MSQPESNSCSAFNYIPIFEKRQILFEARQITPSYAMGGDLENQINDAKIKYVIGELVSDSWKKEAYSINTTSLPFYLLT